MNGRIKPAQIEVTSIGRISFPSEPFSVDNLLKTVDKLLKLGKSRPFVRNIYFPTPPDMGVSFQVIPYSEFPLWD